LLDFCVVLLVFSVFVSSAVCVEVGVKAGDWAEYSVGYSGSPPEYYPQQIRIEVLDVQATNVTLSVERVLINGTVDVHNVTGDVAFGMRDLFIIPANISAGDSFFQVVVGGVPVAEIEDVPYAGAERSILLGMVSQISFRWDKATGILVEAVQESSNFTQRLLITETNMWQSEPSEPPSGPRLDAATAAVVVVLVVAASLVYVLSRRRRATR